ncbi:MAG: serine hydrolase domain-containing protein [Hyphomonas sp.]
MFAVFILSGCTTTESAPGQSLHRPAADISAALADIEPHLQQAAGETGAAIIIFEPDGSIMYQASTGELSTDEPIFVASASKWVAAALLMVLVDEGLLELDVPASRYAPYLTGNKAGITLRQMFSHTSGMNSGHAVEAIPTGSMQSFARELGELPLESDPGTTMSYGGVSMQIAGAIMEDVAGQSFQSLFLERLAEPLGMKDAFFCHPLECNASTPEAVTNPLIGGGLKISAADYGNFLRMIAGRGTYNGHRIMSEKAVAELSKVVTVGLNRGAMPGVSKPDWEYALGQWCHEGEGEKCSVIQSVGAFGAYPWIDKTRGLFGIVMTDSLLPLVFEDIISIRTSVEDAYDASLTSLERSAASPAH